MRSLSDTNDGLLSASVNIFAFINTENARGENIKSCNKN